MPLDTPSLPNGPNIPPGGPLSSAALQKKIASLNNDLRHHSATNVMRAALAAFPNLTLVSSFGAEAVALLHLASMVKKDLPILFIDTELLFTETLVYQQELSEQLGLRNITILKSAEIAQTDPNNTLHKTDQNACCALRKTAPLQDALQGFDGWITGRKRFQSGTRAAMQHFECETQNDAQPPRIKVNPMAHWAPTDVADYITENRLPRHPLVAKGYPSIGCAPCTSPVKPGEDSRAGRWRDTEKEECGIHFVNGKMVRQRNTV